MLIPQAIVQSGSSAPELLAIQYYAAGATYTTNSATLADVDATNAAVTFMAPASGKVLVRASAWVDNGAGEATVGLRESTSNISGTITRVGRGNTDNDFEQYLSVPMYVTGISAGSHTYKLSFAVSTGTFRILLGDGTGTGGFGPLIMEVWSVP